MVTPADFADLTPDLLDTPPLPRAETIPSAWYLEPRFDALDRAAVLARTWQYVGHAARVAGAGDYLVADVAGHPVVVVRDTDGALRAFYNVCRHRAGPLATCDGHAQHKVFQCAYHGWTYRLDGSLRGVPSFDRVELFDKRDFGLVPVRVDVWEELVFVNLDPGAAPAAGTFAGIAERVAPQRVAGKRFARRVAYEVACNWKVYVDNFLEGYHVPLVHPELVRLYDYRSYRTEVEGAYSLQHSPLAEGDNAYTGGGGHSFYYQVFPNFMLNVTPGRLQTNLVLPTGPTTCRVLFEYFYDDVESPGAQRRLEEDLRFSDHVQQEDIGICQHVQRGLASPAYDRGRFSVKYEEGVWHFHRLLRAAYARWLDGATA